MSELKFFTVVTIQVAIPLIAFPLCRPITGLGT
jgi:hypothetical protein